MVSEKCSVDQITCINGQYYFLREYATPLVCWPSSLKVQWQFSRAWPINVAAWTKCLCMAFFVAYRAYICAWETVEPDLVNCYCLIGQFLHSYLVGLAISVTVETWYAHIIHRKLIPNAHLDLLPSWEMHVLRSTQVPDYKPGVSIFLLARSEYFLHFNIAKFSMKNIVATDPGTHDTVVKIDVNLKTIFGLLEGSLNQIQM
jgi:hypothetical protein